MCPHKLLKKSSKRRTETKGLELTEIIFMDSKQIDEKEIKEIIRGRGKGEEQEIILHLYSGFRGPSQKDKKYVLKPTENTYSFKERKITIGLGGSYDINLETIVSKSKIEKLKQLEKLYNQKNGMLLIDFKGNLEFSPLFTNVLLHDPNGKPFDWYGGSLESGYDVKLGKDNIYRNINFWSNTSSLKNRCHTTAGGKPDFPFQNRPIVKPKEFISLIIPGTDPEDKREIIEKKQKEIKNKEATKEITKWYEIGKNGTLIATFLFKGKDSTS